jgi:Zn-dependent M28 family amino/carboxypeptidase
MKASVVTLASSRHIYVQFASSAYSPLFKLKTVLAHYDRMENTPGANDNSAAVFALLEWAVRLHKSDRQHNVRLFFTDSEESAGTSGGVREQGAFAIASGFKALGNMGGDVYVFDCCGRGDVPVLSSAGTKNAGNAAFKNRFDDLYRRTSDLLRAIAPESWMKLPVPYSDNAGFIAAGIPAVAITMLPSAEATKFLFNLRQDKKLEAAVLSASALADPALWEKLPETWRLIHTPNDTIASLTPKTAEILAKLLDRLADAKALA